MSELDQLAAHLFYRYEPALLQSLHMNDLTFTQALFKYKLCNEEMKHTLHSMTTLSDKASFFLEHAMKPGINSKRFRNLLLAMKESSHDNVVDLAYEVQLHLVLLQGNAVSIQSKK